jgi:calcium/calmodulin dependent protein kinase II association protein
LFLVSALSLAKSLIDRKEGAGLKGVLSAHWENVRIDWERAMVTRILLAAILCLIPAYAAAQTDTGPRRDIAAIHHLIWIFRATMRKDGSAVTTHGIETQVYRRESGKWRLVHVHYSEDRQSVP